MSLTIRALAAGAAIAAGTALVVGGTLVPAAAASRQGASQQAAGTAVPSGFKANSITWLSPSRGWVLGGIASGKTNRADVIGTTDGGATWRQLGRVGEPIATNGQSSHAGITEIRMATRKVGWAFGPGLLRTTNGGATWRRVAIPGGKQVLDLAIGSARVYAIDSPCAWETGLCGHKPLTLWRTSSLTDGTWTRVPLSLPANVSADVAVYRTTVYVTDPVAELIGGKDKFYVSTDGSAFAARPVPCDHSPDLGLVQAVPTSATGVALLCDGNPGFSKAVKRVYVSADTGRTYRYAGTMGQFGIQAELAVSPSGNLAVASWSDGSFIYINDGHHASWKMIIGSGDGGAGWNDIDYVSASQAWVVYGPADMFSGYGQVYVTRDGGRHWTLAKL